MDNRAADKADKIDSANGGLPLLPLRLNGVSYRAGGDILLSSVSLTVAPQRRVIVLGPNGAGKSLLLRICHGLLIPSAGELHWSEPDPRRRRRAQAMVFQKPVLLRRSALANVRYALAVAGINRSRRRALALDALERVGLAALAARPAVKLSGGEQQRLALARAWALRPQLLLLDEPTASLDPAATRAVEEAVQGIHAAGTTIIMTTHDLGQARRIADEVVFLHRGRLREQTPAGQFFDRPDSAEARTFLAGELLG